MRFTLPGREHVSEHPWHQEGVRASVKQTAKAAAQYASARLRLAALETKLAAGQVKLAVILLACALMGMLAAAGLLLTGLVLWLSRAVFGGETAAASAAVGGVLLVGVFFAVRAAMKSMKGKSFYPVTRTELNRDKEWLHHLP